MCELKPWIEKDWKYYCNDDLRYIIRCGAEEYKKKARKILNER